MELLPPSLLWLPADVWGCIMSCLCPRDVCVFSCSTSKALQIADSRRRGVLLARHWGRLQVRAARQHMRARSTFVRDTCSMAQLLSRESCQAQILETLQRSPDPIPDLAAAVQQGLALITTQTSLHDTLTAPLRSDLVRCANFVCLLAWRQHMRARLRRRAAAQQHAGHQAALHIDAPALAAGAGPATAAAQQEDMAGLAGAAAGGQQQQQQPAVQAAAVQTELGPSLLELQELLSGFSGLMASPGNPSMRLSRPSLNLLLHLLQQQLQAWHLQPVEAEAELQPVEQAQQPQAEVQHENPVAVAADDAGEGSQEAEAGA